MAIPLTYNLRSVGQRWTSTLVAIIGIAGTVSVFVAMLAMAQGFKATLVASGSPGNALVRRAGASAEVESAISLDQLKVIEDAPGVTRDQSGPLVSAEVVTIAAFPLASTGTDANAQVRGVSPQVLAVRDNVKVSSGHFFEPGLTELVLGKNATHTYAGFEQGATVRFGGGTWKIVGVFDAGGSAFDSEVWCDANVLNQVYQRPANIFQSVTVHLASPAAFDQFKAALTSDPRLTVQVDRETAYYEKQSQMLYTLITVLGSLVAMVMGIGAVFGALNTMYSAVADRKREIATMRALGFGISSVVTSFIFESLFISFLGGVLGCLLVLPINNTTIGTINWQTFSHLSFPFRVTPLLLAVGVLFALLMGLIGGVPPAIRAARRPIAMALREL